MKKIVYSILILSIILAMTVVGLVGCRDTRTNYPDADKYSVGAGEYSASSVRAIDVAWTVGEVNVVFSSEYSTVRVSEENSKEGEDLALHHYLDPDGTLWIKPVSGTIDEDEIPSSGEWTTKKLTVTAPVIHLTKASFENHGGEMLVSGLVANELYTSNTGRKTGISNATVYGNVTMTATGTGDQIFGGAVTGDVNISASLNKAALSTSVVPRSIKLKGHGEVRLTLPETGFKASYIKATNFSTTFEDLQETTTPSELGESYKTVARGDGSLSIVLNCTTAAIGNKNKTYLYKYEAPTV